MKTVAILIVVVPYGVGHADDRDLILFGAGRQGTNIPPANVLLVLDSSGSMARLVCEDLAGDERCCISRNSSCASQATTVAAPNAASVCQHTVLDRQLGPDTDGDGQEDLYLPRFGFDGQSTQGSFYPIFDDRKAGPNDDKFLPSGVFDTSGQLRESRQHANEHQALKNTIDAACAGLSNCEQRSRCIYSYRTRGYFWEPSGNSCASGDPMDMCIAASSGSELGESCSNDGDCTSGICHNGVCSGCRNNGQCSGGGNWCSSWQCSHNYCTRDGCGVTGGTVVAQDLRVVGDFLNFYPPKAHALVKALRSTIERLDGDVRLGISDFEDVGRGGHVQLRLQPPCSQARGPHCLDGDPATPCFDPSSAELEQYLYNTYSPRGFTPLARVLDNSGAYFARTSGVSTGICDYSGMGTCGDANNFIVLVTDGLPTADASSSAQVPFASSQVPALRDGYFYDHQPSQWVDDVAKALSEIDHRPDIAGSQTVQTYTVSYGVLDANDSTRCHGLLEQVSRAGGGRCLPAKSVQELQSALVAVLREIVLSSQGFSAPAVPTTRLAGEASLASATFRPAHHHPVWEGHLYGLQLCDEGFAGQQCQCADNGTVCVLDALGAPISFDGEGHMTSSPYWDAQMCLSKDPNQLPTGFTPEDQSDLDTSRCFLSAAQRRIYTAVDSNGDGRITAGDGGGEGSEQSRIKFSAANVGQVLALRDALDVGGDESRAIAIVDFFRGLDTPDLDGDGDASEDRNLATLRDGSNSLKEGWWKLGDVFHSIPNTVVRPDGRTVGAWASTQSYLAFVAAHAARPRTILVGANDGMLHAFHAGDWQPNLHGGRGGYDHGTGEELWAFVSPEMLPELRHVCDPAQSFCGADPPKYLLDGSVMVRDVWVGDAADDKEDPNNQELWRTIAVVGHRRGGTSYLALDVTDIREPRFLWQFPQAGDWELSVMGQSWLDTFPAPASIGPLRVDTNGTVHDRWVVLVSAGFDPIDRKGNALFMLDASTGAVVWSVTRGNTNDVTDAMRYSFPATPVFYPSFGQAFPYIAGIVAVDHGGQVWHVPTRGVTKLQQGVYDFPIELVFRAAAAGPTDLVGGNGDGRVDLAEYHRRPFFFAPVLTFARGKVRVLAGTGDRDMLIPAGLLPPNDGSEGTPCSQNVECSSGLECVAGRCSTCQSDNQCGGGNRCVAASCLYHHCDDQACELPYDEARTSPDVSEANCTREQRIYSFNLESCLSAFGETRACDEDDLEEVIIPSNGDLSQVTFAQTSGRGWYEVLQPGEKVAAPGDLLNGHGFFSSFLPTLGCGHGSTQVCSSGSPGEARMRSRHFLTGRPLDWNGDAQITPAEIVLELGEGVPSAPAISASIRAGTAAPALLTMTTEGGLKSTEMPGMITRLLRRVAQFFVSRRLHNTLHTQ